MNRLMRRHPTTPTFPPPRTSGSAKGWFDQFPGLTEGSVWDNPHWCPRHWAPAALLGYQGGLASRLLLEYYMTELKPSNITSPRAINRHLSRQLALCCQAGDERMYALWGQCARST